MAPLYLTTAYFRSYAQEIQKQYKKTRCQITGTNKYLSVHHIIAYKDLLKEAFRIAGVTYKRKVADISLEDREKVITALHILHNKDNVVTINRELHKQYHKHYKEVNEETWKAFVASKKRKQPKGAKRK